MKAKVQKQKLGGTVARERGRVGAKASTLNRRQAALSAGAFDYFQLPAEIDLLVLRVGQVVALRQTMERLRSEADLDHLTGLANRRRFRVALNGELERFRRYSVPCALLQLDIDHMKEINDRFGHPVGDVSYATSRTRFPQFREITTPQRG